VFSAGRVQLTGLEEELENERERGDYDRKEAEEALENVKVCFSLVAPCCCGEKGNFRQ
jgi:hypothetical protein